MVTTSEKSNFIKNRSCTNLCFAFFFLLFLIGWSIISFLAFKYGNPEQIIFPSDSYGRICGRGKLKNKPFLFFFNILKCAKVKSITDGCKTKQVCVDKCPTYTISYAKFKTSKDRNNEFNNLSYSEKNEIKRKLICDYNIQNYNVNEIPRLLTNEACASIYLKSDDFAGRCIPTALRRLKSGPISDDRNNTLVDEDIDPVDFNTIKQASKKVSLLLSAKAYGEQIVEDIANCWKFILAGFFVGMIISFIWILLMQLIAGTMVWISMIVLIFLSGVISFIFFKQYQFYKQFTPEELDNLETDELESDLNINFTSLIKVQIRSILANKTVWLILTIVSSIVFIVLTLTFIFLRKRVHIAVSIIKEASKAITYAKFSLFFPIIPYIFQLFIIVFSVFIALLITATSKELYRYNTGPKYGLSCDPLEIATNQSCSKFKLIENRHTRLIHLYNLFGLFWSLYFIKGMCQLIFALVFSTYYWTLNKRQVPSFLILNSTSIAIKYHVGSVAIGSFLIATLKTIQVIFEYINRKCKQYNDNPISRAITWLCRCCFWCLESFLKFINSNAYIMIAIHGNGYFTSAKNAFSLILDNIVRVAVIDQVADYLLFIGKICVTSIMGFATYFYIKYASDYKYTKNTFPEIHFIIVPVACISIGTYVIASTFFSVYDMAVDTLFLCFLKDCQENDGSAQKPYYMSKRLMRILNYRNKKISNTKSIEN